jgi:hypothetical protein
VPRWTLCARTRWGKPGEGLGYRTGAQRESGPGAVGSKESIGVDSRLRLVPGPGGHVSKHKAGAQRRSGPDRKGCYQQQKGPDGETSNTGIVADLCPARTEMVSKGRSPEGPRPALPAAYRLHHLHGTASKTSTSSPSSPISIWPM